MAITVSFTPNITTWMQGDASIVVSLSGSYTAGFEEYYWESDGGTFSNKFAASPTFTPTNATKEVSVIGRKVIQFLTGLSTPANFTAYGSNGQRKTGGSSATWEHGNTGTGLSSNSGFFEWEITETATEKVAGLMADTTYIDPLLTGSNSFLLAWHYSANGTVVPRKQGVALTLPIFCKAGDVAKIFVDATKAYFYYNKQLITTTTRPSGNLYGVAGFKTLGAIIDAPRFSAIPTTNEAVKILSVNGIFPQQPNYSFEINEDNVTLVSFAEDRSARYKVKGGIKKNLNLQFVQRTYAEYLSIHEFWKTHQKHVSFYYKDIDLESTYRMVFDSGLRVVVNSPNSVTLSFVLREV